MLWCSIKRRVLSIEVSTISISYSFMGNWLCSRRISRCLCQNFSFLGLDWGNHCIKCLNMKNFTRQNSKKNVFMRLLKIINWKLKIMLIFTFETPWRCAVFHDITIPLTCYNGIYIFQSFTAISNHILRIYTLHLTPYNNTIWKLYF